VLLDNTAKITAARALRRTVLAYQSSHVVMITQPQEVTGVILTALAAAPQKEEQA
jgi:hypothetical protein